MSVPIPDGVQMSILLRGSSFEVVPCRYARSFARNGGLLDSLHLSNLGDETYSISMSLPKVPVEGQPLVNGTSHAVKTVKMCIAKWSSTSFIAPNPVKVHWSKHPIFFLEPRSFNQKRPWSIYTVVCAS